MNYGLYLSASGVLTNLYRQDVYANNLANVETTGFKVDTATLRQRKPEQIEDPAGFDTSNRLLERLGGGTIVGTQRIDFSAAQLKQTHNPLDAALTDDNTFFTIEHRGANGQAETRLTRDGRFTVGSSGELVTVTGGKRVLDAQGNAITLDGTGPAAIASDGQVTQAGQPVAPLGVVRVADTQNLVKQGQNLFRYEGNGELGPAQRYGLQPGFLEASGADPIKTLMQVTKASKSVTSNSKLIQYHDNLMDNAVNTLGRVA